MHSEEGLKLTVGKMDAAKRQLETAIALFFEHLFFF